MQRYHRAVRQAVGFSALARTGRVAAADVEDAVQQAFLTFFHNDGQVLRRWLGDAGLRTYLCRVAERVAQRHFQRALTRRGRFRLDLDEPVESGESRVERLEVEQPAHPEVEALLAERSERDRLREAILERLSEKGRQYYQWLFVDELDVTAIAELDQTNPNNVYQWKNRITRAAHDVLVEAGYAN